jgi:hypothetical protein
MLSTQCCTVASSQPAVIIDQTLVYTCSYVHLHPFTHIIFAYTLIQNYVGGCR